MIKSSRRLYVARIPQAISETELRAVFGIHGELAGCKLEEDRMVPDKQAAFITYKTKEDVNAVLVAPAFEIKGEKLSIAPATAQKQQLFVGGYDLYVTQPQLEEFFSKYGEVDHVLMKFNHEGISRCFGFVTFRDSPDAVKDLATKRFIPCLGKTVEVKLADPTLCPKKTRSNSFSKARRNSNRSSSMASFENFVKRRKSSSERLRVPSMSSNESASSDIGDGPDGQGRLVPRRYIAPHRCEMSKSRSIDIAIDEKENQ